MIAIVCLTNAFGLSLHLTAMSKTLKIFIVYLLGCFFSVASLEIEIFDYDNSLFDTYDSHVKIDSKVKPRILNVEFDKFDSPEIILLTYCDPFVADDPLPRVPRSSNYFYRPKLFLIKSSLLI